MTVQPIFLGQGKLVTPSEKPQGEAKILRPSNESRGCWVAVYPTHLQIGDVRPGPTKHAAYLFGGIGAYVLKPVFGSLSASSKSYNIPWEKILWIKFNQDLREIDICGVRKEDGRTWLIALMCNQNEKLLRHLASFVKVEGLNRVPEEITQPRVSSESKLNDVLMEDLHDYLNSLGFNAEFADLDRSYTYKGIIRLNGANVDYIAKDTHITGSEIIFIIEDVRSDLRGTQLVVKKRNGQISELRWVGGNEQFIDTLNKDQILMKQLASEIASNNLTLFLFQCHKTFYARIGGKMMYKTKGNRSITIQSYTQRLPPKEYFQAIDRLAHYVRTSA